MTRLVKAWIAYGLIVAAMTCASLWTGRNASRIAGAPHYLLTTTSVPVRKAMAAENETDAEFDELFAEAGEPVTLLVDEPAFVLGLLDATAPTAIAGGAILATATLLTRRRARRPAGHGISGPEIVE